MTIEEIKQNYPTVYKALKHIAHDNGMINRLEPESALKGAPENYINHMTELEDQAKRLGDKLETFCTGDEFEINKLITAHGVELLDNFLCEWFEVA